MTNNFPDDWKRCLLGSPDVSEIISGQSPSSDTYNTEGIGLPFFQGKAEFGSLYPVPEKWCSQPIKIAKRNDVLMSVRAPVGDVNLCSQDSCIGRGLAAIRASKDANYRFLYYFFIEKADLIASYGTGSTFKSINRSTLLNLSITLPPLPEQRKIAAVLAKVQRAVELQEAILANLRELKKSTMHRLFTHGLRGEKLKQTEIGKMPVSWEVVKLGDLAKENGGIIQTGPFGSQLHAYDYIKDGIPVVNPTHMAENRINHEDLPTVSGETAARLNRHTLKTGDILFARRGEIGRHGFVTESENGWLCGTGCFLVRVNSKRADNQYLAYLFDTEFYTKWLVAHAAGVIMPNLNTSVLERVPVKLPGVVEQGEIVRCFRFINEKIAVHESKQTALQDLFKTMLNQLMTGTVRVKELDIDTAEI